MREKYDGDSFDLQPEDLAGDGRTAWVTLWRSWFDDAVAANAPEPNAMVLATIDETGLPATRTVLCKGLDERGVVFYTNYGSDKAHAVEANPVAAVTFPWIAIHRQVHVRGAVTKVTPEETAAYWAQRPRGSQLGAWASDQSRPVASRAAMAERFAEVEARFEGRDVPVPPEWGGYRIAPQVVEFWQGRENRVHNRVRLVAPEYTPVRLQP
ncbi:pyridoxamine 5'-phosphate oxidase [Tsukamurella paurometabola]|uniref:Pyridoxine/pyridoxamine 5'-phosphate oxidase n=1 Tax=Tsukamurella paurometabola TaxID=2061 RepID=A0A3P8KDB5_TSUPA|nr:pyridoxamine 5'-phosphate oxidase [Tsukamurella paurometabola]UEA85559.1 pyridoxamine 5'-phosphate oxidase [Tsukamurella paurometabola]VDR37618.1 Pyridoxine/pyridoxamine 5'-phosphate oxidase [Tsukamurella paurometabola]